MTCYHPLIRAEHKWKKKIAADGHLYADYNIFSPNNYNRLEQLKDNDEYTYTLIPCGKCIGCRLEYSRQWANRGYLESKYSEGKNWFVTLTYNEEHMPKKEETLTSDGITYWNDGTWNGTLMPEHLTKFIHDIRQYMKRHGHNEKIRYMACGEYGEKGQRPHYHIIFYNLDLPPEDLHMLKVNFEKDIYWRSDLIEHYWKYGYSLITEASWNTIAYVARYITKKINGEQSEHYYASKGQEKEFFRTSRRPGIAKKFYDINKDKIYEYNKITISNKGGVHTTAPPRYFDKCLKIDDPEFYEERKKILKEQAKVRAKCKDMETSLERILQLAIEERTQTEKYKTLKRTFEQKIKK